MWTVIGTCEHPLPAGGGGGGLPLPPQSESGKGSEKPNSPPAPSTCPAVSPPAIEAPQASWISQYPPCQPSPYASKTYSTWSPPVSCSSSYVSELSAYGPNAVPPSRFHVISVAHVSAWMWTTVAAPAADGTPEQSAPTQNAASPPLPSTTPAPPLAVLPPAIGAVALVPSTDPSYTSQDPPCHPSP